MGKRRGQRRGRAARLDRPDRPPFLGNLALLAGSLLLFCLVSEGVLRLLTGPETNWFGNGTGDNFLASVRRNSDGFRDVEHAIRKEPGVTRIALVGDSFVFGVPIRDERKIFPGLLQGKLGPRYEVMNVAAPGFNTQQQVAALANVSEKYGLDKAVLFFFANDVEAVDNPAGDSFYDHLVPGQAGHYLYRHSRFYYLLESRVFRLLERLGSRHSYADYLRSLYAPDSRDLAAHREFFRGFLASIDRTRFVVVVIPVLHDLENYKFGAAHDYVKGLAAEQGVAVVDLREAFKGMRAEDLIVNAYDYHFNERAHAIVADYLLVALKRIGFL